MRISVACLLATSAWAATAAAKHSPKDVFTPEDMLQAARPGGPVVSPDGQHAIEAVNEYIFKTANNSTFAYLNVTTLYTRSIGKAAKARRTLQLPTQVESLKYEPVTGRLAFSAAVWEDGSLYNTERNDKDWEARSTSGVVYDELFVRHWDTWRTPGRVHQLFVTDLAKTKDDEAFKPSHTYWAPFNATGRVSQMDPIAPSAYDISPSRLVMALHDPSLSPAFHTKMNFYVARLDGSAEITSINTASHGAISSVSFSPDSTKLSWLEQAEDGYESDRNRVVVYDYRKDQAEEWTATWDRSPSSVTWSRDSSSLYLIAENKGRALPYHLSTPSHLPTPLLFRNGSASSIKPVSNDRLLLSLSSLTSPSDTFMLSSSIAAASHHSHPTELVRVTDWNKKTVGDRLSGQAGEEFWFKGADGWDVMGWAVKPPGWTEGQKKKWPMAFLIHGGPQGAWEDSWSTRWNPAIFAQQGYFVIAINPTGSTGYGQEFTDRIKQEWGGRPYKDLVAGYAAALELFPEIDPERTAALGASYGGYMINWINGHPGAFNFKALVCHDGVFNTVDTFYSTDEVYFASRENGGPPTTHRADFEKWNPANHVSEWSTPQLVIHSGKDFRLTESSGLSAFTALQMQGVPSRFLYFPEENHWVLKPGNSQKWHAEVFRWLEEWVGERKAGLVVQ